MSDAVLMAEIVSSLKEGLKGSYFQNLLLSEPDSDIQSDIIEYLFTVNVAQRLLNWKSIRIHEGYSIRLEYDAHDFVNNAFPQIRFAPFLNRLNHLPARDGRIDIAILKKASTNPLSICGIELKGINPSTAKVKEDLERLCKAMTEIDPIGNNSINFSFCAFVERLDTERELFDDSDLLQRVADLKQNLETEFSGIVAAHQGLKMLVELENIYSAGTADYAASILKEYQDYNEAVENTGAAIGVVLRLEREAVPGGDAVNTSVN